MTDPIIQFIKFMGIGVWNTVFDIVLWHLLLKILPPKLQKVGIAQAISFGTASVVSFVLNLYLTFGDKNLSGNLGNLGLIFGKFVVVTIFFTMFSSVLITFLANYNTKDIIKNQRLSQKLNQKLISKLVVVIITLPLTYFTYKYFVYL